MYFRQFLSGKLGNLPELGEASLVIWTHMEVFRERELLIIKTHSERGKPHTHCGPLDRICSQNQGGAGPVLAADWFSYC